MRSGKVMSNKLGRQAIIDCGKLHENIAQIKSVLPEQTGIIAVVKGDAYGHDIRIMAKELSMDRNVTMLAVSSLEEARAISTVRQDILVMYPVYISVIRNMMQENNFEENKKLIQEKFIFTIGNLKEYNLYKGLAQQFGISFRIHLRLDFQGGVKGFSKAEYENININEILNDRELRVCGIYAHVYSTYSDDRTLKINELEEYATCFRSLPDNYADNSEYKIMKHLLTTPCFEEFPQYCFDAVRIGAAIYGMPVGYSRSRLNLDCIMKISANIVRIVNEEEDVSIDYSGHESNAKKIALVPIGNWDIPHFFNGSECHVRVNGVLTTIVGEPCMDTCCIDVTNITDVDVGDTVYFLDDQPGITFLDKMKENGYNVNDCQMLYVGVGRLPKIYEYN